MEFGFTEEQKMLKRELRVFFAKENPKALVREIEEKQLDYSPELYHKMAELGFLGLMIPEKYGGVSGNWIDMALFHEEAGYALLQSPYFNNIAQSSQAILELGTEQKKKELLSLITDGNAVISLALTEPGIGVNPSLVATSAVFDGKNFILNGRKSFISYAHIADFLIVVAKNENDKLSLFLIERGQNGLVCNPENTIDGERVCEILLNEVRVPRSSLLSELSNVQCVSEIIEKSMIALCAQSVGVAQAAFEMALDYAKLRKQFGAPIGSFQAIQHKLASMLVALEGARWITYYAAWLQSEQLPSTKERSMAVLYAGEASRNITSEAVQIHGATGVMEEHDVSLYFRRAKGIQTRLGYPHMCKESICDAMGM